MKIKEYVDEVLLRLGGGVVKVELEDNQVIERVLSAAFREVQRYINITKFATVNYSRCIDLSAYPVYAVTQVMRGRASNVQAEMTDALYLALSSMPYGMGGMSDYRSYLRTQQIKNTLTSDLDFIWDQTTKRLYVDVTYPIPSQLTLAYIPVFTNPEDISDPFWEDVLCRLTLAIAKETLGRIRGKYVQNNVLISLDADQLLTEGREELATIRAQLQENSDLTLPIN